MFGPPGTCGAPKFPENPIVPLPCSRTPAEPRCLAFAALRCCPPTTGPGGPRRSGVFRSSIPRPQHWLFTLRAAIAGDDAKLASGVWPIFPGWDSSVPTEFCREVSAFRLPLPLGFACRDSFSLLPWCKTHHTRPPFALQKLKSDHSREDSLWECNLHLEEERLPQNTRKTRKRIVSVVRLSAYFAYFAVSSFAKMISAPSPGHIRVQSPRRSPTGAGPRSKIAFDNPSGHSMFTIHDAPQMFRVPPTESRR